MMPQLETCLGGAKHFLRGQKCTKYNKTNSNLENLKEARFLLGEEGGGEKPLLMLFKSKRICPRFKCGFLQST